MLKRVRFIALHVHDQDRALAFYTDQIGRKVFTDQRLGDMRCIELKIPGAETMLVLHRQADHAPSTQEPAVCFDADDVNRTFDELRVRGVEFAQPPTKEHWGEYALFRDSEGNLVLFSKS